MRQNEIDRKRIEKEISEYLEKGGKITECPPFQQSQDLRKAQEGINHIYLALER